MDSFGYMFGIMGFVMAIMCLQDLNKTKEILSKYVNDEDKLLLLTKEKPKKKLYVVIWEKKRSQALNKLNSGM
jgi:transcription elongation factor GreA-like protein